MKRIQNVTVRLSGDLSRVAAEARAAVVDTQGVYTTTAHFLCGENPWGFHQDRSFSFPVSQVRRGSRICEAAERAKREDAMWIDLSPEDHAALLFVLTDPTPTAESAVPPALAREILPIVEAIEFAPDVVRAEESK